MIIDGAFSDSFHAWGELILALTVAWVLRGLLNSAS